VGMCMSSASKKKNQNLDLQKKNAFDKVKKKSYNPLTTYNIISSKHIIIIRNIQLII